MLRLFVALELPSHLKHEMAWFKNETHKEIKDVKWVSEENLHITLKFLGNCEEELLPEIESGLKNSLKKFSPFDFYINGLGVFPSIKRARVLWVGIKSGGENIVKLQQAIEENFAKIGFAKDEKIFFPHITFARLKNLYNVEKFFEKIEAKGFSESRVEVSNISLLRSSLMSQGPVYEKILELKLKTD
ncbi:RNA 2',3'-cyclic phosphodiesterase [Candidatus Oleimmundimicrobium sp.]|uniref:RNA 2',3'-cyclic phosphodiesterase n=1 Tax=Candidatus Oleimmundimicrobium sp. TaxID=3060597 RepID=UPI00271F6EC3|nr:RNA 2',3'-cyclic phosphodiesterase [Candidatus Oleimmundimicrobium sp.]MDO8885430.1 RNA 2',3'-cyclic phosphodiesterase [Candidatus Oleimmundimicrobium sp.]